MCKKQLFSEYTEKYKHFKCTVKREVYIFYHFVAFVLEILFKIERNTFVRTLNLCFDMKEKNLFYIERKGLEKDKRFREVSQMA